MKKKIAIIAFVVAAVTALVFLFSGCGSIVDIGGNYQAKTSSEVAEMMQNTDTVMKGNFEYKLSMDIRLGSDNSMSMDMNGIFGYIDDSHYAFSGDYKLNMKAEGISSNGSASIYFDSEYLYMNTDGTKVKMPIDSSGFTDQIVIGDINDFIGAISSNAKYSVADEGDIKKIKIEMNINEDGITAPAEYYIIMEKNFITGFALKCKYNDSIDGIKTYMNIDMQMGATLKTVPVPSDLDSYTSATV